MSGGPSNAIDQFELVAIDPSNAIELKLNWTKLYCVLSAAGNDNLDNNDNDNNGNKLLSKGFKCSVYWNKQSKKLE